MIKDLNINLAVGQDTDQALMRKKIAVTLNVRANEIRSFRIVKKSVDARKGQIRINLRVTAYINEDAPAEIASPVPAWASVAGKPAVLVVGSGPAGLFAALTLIEKGLRPIVVDRGSDTAKRKRDIALISTSQRVDPESNYCFGEGGAGTFSDGKLYTRSNKRGDIGRILQILHAHGADAGILSDAHPHIGTDRLPAIINRIRDTIIGCGGEVHFDRKFIDLVIEDGRVHGAVLADGATIRADALVLATGHSARDVYGLCQRRGLALQAKTFAMGVRVEHPRAFIDGIQYHGDPKANQLPAASYSLTAQVDGRGVYSFCMCPGGVIVPSATADDEIVVNGMSAAGRNTRWSNAGIVVEIRPEDVPEAGSDPMAGSRFQRWLEQECRRHGDGQKAPAQRLDDFVAGRASVDLPESSYTPGLVPSRLDEWLPPFIAKRLQAGFLAFDQKMRGFVSHEALVVGVESRTSSPLRIPRDPDTLQHPELAGLFPCGEGSGYAGGIVSSAMDGEKAAGAVAAWVKVQP